MIKHRVVGLALLAGLLIGGVGCQPRPVGTDPESAPARVAPSSPRPPAAAEVGTDAAPDSRFVPDRIDLPGGIQAAVVPVSTVAGSLVVPDDVGQVGWWDGSAQVGDPYGATVIAGHVDSAEQGIGFFRRLWSIKVGDHLTVRADELHRRFRVTEIRRVDRRRLADDQEVFAQTGPPRLILLTCIGAYDRARGGYADNLVVVARPA
ncbi:class F sortase [Microlunatus speluncae]|uniref:class F sortase n=1 Tax=Microlunatus speluncae TaxID=2594267 RepID=UPI001FE9B028|nr:class F sortase [Microlunatus speluncae]